MKKIKKKRTRQYDPKKTERILLNAHHKVVIQEAMKPLRSELAQHYCDLLAVHVFKMVRGEGTSVSLDVLCFFGILSKNLAQLANVKSQVGDKTLEAIQHAAETAYYKKVINMDLRTGQKNALLALNEFCSKQIIAAPTAYFVDAYKHAQRCVVDMNRKGGVVASFGEMPEWGQPYLTFENFKAVIAQAKESIEAESNLRYKINLYALEYDEESSKLAEQEAEKMALDQRLFVDGQTIESIPPSLVSSKKIKQDPELKKRRIANLAEKNRQDTIDRIALILETAPLLFTSLSLTKKGDYSSAKGFIAAAKQRDMILATGFEISRAAEYVNTLHDAYPAWKEAHILKDKPKRTSKSEIRA